MPIRPSAPLRVTLNTLLGVWTVLTMPASLLAQRDSALQHQAWGTAEGLPQNSVHAIVQTPDGFLWIATEAGLARFDGIQFTAYNREQLSPTAGEDLCCLAVDANGVLWAGSSLGLTAFDHSLLLQLPNRAPFTHNSVHQLLIQNGHAVAITDSGAFMLQANGQANQIASPSIHNQLPPPVLKDHEGNTWFGSPKGLQRISPGQTTATDVPSLAGQSILSLMEDAEGDIWVGTETTGLHRLHPSVFHTLSASQGTPVAAVAWSSSGTLLGTREGELRLIPANGESRVLANFGAGITALAVTPDAAWAGTTDGLYRIGSNARITRYTSADGLPDDYIRSLATNSNGDIWAGTAHGLAHLTGTRIEILTVKNGLGGDLIGALLPARTPLEHPAGVWAATESGLSLLEGSRVTRSISVPGSVVAAMAYGQHGTLWFATQDGALWQYRDGAEQKILQLSVVSDRQSVRALFVDRHNTLWIVLRDGVLSASIPRLSACTPQSCRSLTSLITSWNIADGMSSTESLPGGFGQPVQDGNGNILFATRAGIAVADPEQATRALPVPVVIERTTLEDHPLNTQQLQSIPYGRTRLTFDYAGISLGDPGRVRYRVRLHGFDRNWVETGTHRSATYTALSPGPYQLEIQATLEGQPWPDTSTSLAFRIAPPFYRRWWFLLLSGLLILSLILLIYRLRLAAERRRFALIMTERNRLAREVHDTLAQDLVSTGIQLDVVMFALDKQPRERTVELLRTLRRRVAQTLAEARESIGELRDPNLRLDLPSRFRRMTERKSTPSLPVRLEVLENPRPLPPGMEIELLRIAGEAVENALRHASATAIVVQIQSTPNALAITVADNGCGFVSVDAQALSGHYGLRGMQERADAIGATLAITSTIGNGATVSVSVRYPR